MSGDDSHLMSQDADSSVIFCQQPDGSVRHHLNGMHIESTPLRQQVLVRKSLSSGRNDGHDYHKSVATKNHNGLHRYGLRDYWSD